MHDLVVTKLAAGRLKDLEFVGALVQRALVDLKTIRSRIRQFPIERDRPFLRARLQTVLDDLNKATRC
jgi:hypothetical protein